MLLFFKYGGKIFFMALLFTMISCNKDAENIVLNDLQILPIDTGGEQKAEYFRPGENVYGHYIYLPGGYTAEGPKYPLIVFLHGSGEKGNSQTNPDELLKVLRNGPPHLISNKQWHPQYPAIVVSPQCHENWWDADKIHDFIGYIIQKYNVNENRIYVTGLSMGGFGTFSYIEAYGDLSYAAAIVPLCGGGNPAKASSFVHTPVWAFHGDADKTVSIQESIDMINAINEMNPQYKAKLTVYPGIDHNCWSMTYDGSGMGKESSFYDPFNEDIYTWMFQYTKNPTSQPPG